MPVRVLVVSNMYPPHHLGGYELSCRDTAERFRDRGHDVAVLTSTMRRPEVLDPSGERGAGIRRDLLLYWHDHELLRPPLREQVRVERHNQRVLTAALEEVEPEVVSFWNMGAVSMGVLTAVVEREIPTVLVVCDNWLVYGPLVDPWAARFARHRVLAKVIRRLTGVPTVLADLDRVEAACFVSESTRRTAVDNTRWSFPRSIVTYSGVERREFPPPGPGEEAGPWRGRLLYVGRVEARKGVETAVQALAGLPQSYTLEILGPGDQHYMADLKRLAESLGVGERVHFDAVARAALRSRYLAADAVVFPSEWAEPFGLVPLEAMACGRPVVATAMGGSAEFLSDGVNCVVFAPGDDQALGMAIRRLADDESLRRRLVDGGLATASEFDTDRLADVLEAWHVAAAQHFNDGIPPSRPSTR
jgi:glycogen(starch) synthase